MGLIGGLAVLPASPTDWDGAAEVFKRVGEGMPRAAKAWADSNSRAKALAEWTTANAERVLGIVLERPGADDVRGPDVAVDRGADVRVVRAGPAVAEGLRGDDREQRGVDRHRQGPPHVPVPPARQEQG